MISVVPSKSPIIPAFFHPLVIIIIKHIHGTDSVVGHLPREISRITYFIITHGAQVSCRMTDMHYRRSPLVQGGIEIPCEVTVKMNLSDQNMLAIEEYKKLVSLVM